ncbi:MAG: macrolide family glycosyltransferase [Pseudonocardiaceae bacterium]
MHVTFLVPSGHGHLNPTLGVVAELVRRGHRVTYPVPEAFTGAIEAVGAEPVLYDSPIHRMSGPPRQVTGSFFANFQLRLLNEAVAMAPVLEKRLAGDRPDLISFDAMGPFAARVLSHTWRRPLVAMVPSLVSNEHFSLWGAFARHAVAAPTDDDPVIIELRERFATFATGHGVPSEQVDAMAAPFSPAAEPQIVFVPRWFQPAADTFDHRYVFVGPCLTDRDHQGEWQPAGIGPVLLISLGTAFNERPEFFRTCAEAFADTLWQVVMSIGTRIDPSELGRLPGNVAAHRHVAQLQVLRHASAFVSHGGMGSTMEALYHGVPLVAVPQMPEQEVNAGRIAELGLGRMLQPDDVTAAALHTAVVELAADGPTRARLAERSRQLRVTDGAALAADTMEAHAT